MRKVGMEKKFDTSEKVRKELEEHMETMRKVLKDKEKKIQDAKTNFVRQRRQQSVNITTRMPS